MHPQLAAFYYARIYIIYIYPTSQNLLYTQTDREFGVWQLYGEVVFGGNHEIFDQLARYCGS